MNEDSLFDDLPLQLSPYLKWLAANNIKTRQVTFEDWVAAQCDGDPRNAKGPKGSGETETDAVNDLVEKTEIEPFKADQLKR